MTLKGGTLGGVGCESHSESLRQKQPLGWNRDHPCAILSARLPPGPHQTMQWSEKFSPVKFMLTCQSPAKPLAGVVMQITLRVHLLLQRLRVGFVDETRSRAIHAPAFLE